MSQSSHKTARLYRRLYPYFWFIPIGVIMSFALVYPWVWSFGLSFTKWNISDFVPPVFVGLRNYVRIVSDPLFQTALLRSLQFILMTVPAQFALGLSIALLLNQNVRGRWFFISASMLPFMLTPSIVGLIWKILLSGQWGVVNYILNSVGIPSVSWLSSPSVSMWTVAIIGVWQYTPWVMLVLFAGLQAIPREMYEAAEVDGASSFQSFRYVTIPFLKPLIVIVLLFRIMFALRTFDVIYSLFRSGGPANSAMVLGVYLYEEFRLTWEIGRSSAISYIILVLTMLLSLGFALRMYRGVEE